MKLFEITDPLADDPDYVLNPEHKKEAILYMWNQLYGKWGSTYGNSLEEQKTEDRLIKHKHLWAKIPDCAFLFAYYIIDDRFPEGESAIAQNKFHKKDYEDMFNCKI